MPSVFEIVMLICLAVFLSMVNKLRFLPDFLRMMPGFRFMRGAGHGPDFTGADFGGDGGGGGGSARRTAAPDGLDLCYKMLGVSPSATWQDIERAYRVKAKIHHPDHGGDEDTMRALNDAYAQIKRMRKSAGRAR